MDGLNQIVQARVSVLEEERLMRRAVAAVLTDAGFQLVADAADPRELAGSLAADKSQVCVLGLNPRGAAVNECLGIVRELHTRHPDIRFVVFSGATDPEFVDACYREGASGYLDKRSADADELVHAVRAASRGERIVPMNLLRSPFDPTPRAPEPAALQAVSLREREVLGYIAGGADNLKIAAMLRISERTVKAHVSSLYKKLGSENRTQLALSALQLGIRPPAEV